MHWVANEKMRRLLGQCENGQQIIPPIKGAACKELLFPAFKTVRDCVIISKTPAENLDAAFDHAIRMYFDKTDYEACNTETRIDCFFENKISMEQGFEIALLTIRAWALQLKAMQPESKFCMILSCDEDHTEIRFHKLRKGESMWLRDNVDDYADGAIGYSFV